MTCPGRTRPPAAARRSARTWRRSPPTSGRPSATPTPACCPSWPRRPAPGSRADGVPAGELTVTGGALDGIERLLAAHLRPGDAVAVEDPGWANLLDLVAALGLRAVGVPVDDEGPTVAGVRAALAAGARALVVTSRAQNPTGAAVSADRADALRALLAGRSGPAARSRTTTPPSWPAYPCTRWPGRPRAWAFVRSVSKPFGPDLRLAVLAGDETTVARVAGRARVGAGWVSTVLQRLVAAALARPGRRRAGAAGGGELRAAAGRAARRARRARPGRARPQRHQRLAAGAGRDQRGHRAARRRLGGRPRRPLPDRRPARPSASPSARWPRRTSPRWPTRWPAPPSPPQPRASCHLTYEKGRTCRFCGAWGGYVGRRRWMTMASGGNRRGLWIAIAVVIIVIIVDADRPSRPAAAAATGTDRWGVPGTGCRTGT